jgi:glycolate oxidase FAD binding subunit
MGSEADVAPDSAEALAAMLREAHADRHSVQPLGGGTKLDWGNPAPLSALRVSLARLDRVVEHAFADMTCTVEAGCRISELQRQLALHGQRLALDPLWPERATVGGVLSTNDSGAWRLRFGGARDLVIGLHWVLADGTIAKSGGKVVKNVAGYDLAKLAVGAFGTLGVITQAVFRVHPVAEQQRTLQARCERASDMQAFVLAVLDSQLAPSAVQMRAATGAGCAVDILLEGTRAGLDAQSEVLQQLLGRKLEEGSDAAWQARQALWDDAAPEDAVLKLSVLPSELERTLTRVASAADSGEVQSVFQATGLGCVRLQLGATALTTLRSELEARGGSVVLLRRPPGLRDCEAFGTIAALDVMRALKLRFDPKQVLNPGRFVRGL